MEFNNFEAFLDYCDLYTLLVSIATSIIVWAVKKIFKDKLPFGISLYLSPVLAVVLQFIVKLLFNDINIAFTMDTVYEGLISGSVSTIITAFIGRIIKGKPADPPAVMFVKGTVDKIVAEKDLNQFSEEILSLINEKTGDEEKIEKICGIIRTYSNQEMEENDVTALSFYLLNSVSALKK